MNDQIAEGQAGVHDVRRQQEYIRRLGRRQPEPLKIGRPSSLSFPQPFLCPNEVASDPLAIDQIHRSP